MSNKNIPNKMLKAITEHDVAVELNGLLFAQAIGIKRDPVGEFIAKFIFTEHNKGNCPNVSSIENTLHESSNTIRKKINTLIAINFVKVVKSNKDTRNKCYEPTALLKRVYEVDMTKRIKCLLELSPLLDSLLGEHLKGHFDDIGTADHPSYLKTQDSYTFNKLIGKYYLDLIRTNDKNEDVKNTLKNLG